MRSSSSRTRFILAALGAVVLAAAGAAAGLHLGFLGGPAPAAAEAAAQSGAPAGESPRQGSAEAASLKTDGSAPAPGGEGEGKPAPVPVSVATVGVGSISSYISSTANLVAENEVKVLAESEGRVEKMRVEEGDLVAPGQVLAALVREDAEIELRKAELKAANAGLAYERAVKTVAESLLSREEFDRLKMQKEVADQELAEARWKLEKRTIRAPFGGRVTERTIRPGQHVKPGETLFTVSDFDPLIARVYLPERDVLGLKEGQEVVISLKASEATRFAGRIRQISPVVDPSTGTVKITVEAVTPPPEVRPGSFVTVEVVRETHRAALLLPRDAVVRELQDAFVYVLRGEVAEKRSIRLGLEERSHVEALSGLNAGDRVVVAGQGSLKDGARVKVLPSREASELEPRRDLPARG